MFLRFARNLIRYKVLDIFSAQFCNTLWQDSTESQMITYVVFKHLIWVGRSFNFTQTNLFNAVNVFYS